MIKSRIRLVISLFGLLFFCQGSSLQEKPAPLPYYATTRITSFNPNEKNHAACAFLIDPIMQEDLAYATPAVTNALKACILAHFFPIIANASLLYNFLNHALFTETKKELNNDWMIYDIPRSSFILLIPESWASYYKQAGLQFESLPRISESDVTENFIKQKGIANKTDYLKEKTASVNFEFIYNLFQSNIENPKSIWDFFIAGHGGYLNNIAGLHFKDMHNLLSILDRQLDCGTINISSCTAGGENRTLLESKDKMPLSYSFILILSSINSSFVRTLITKNTMTAYFNAAAQLADKAAGLDALLNIIASTMAKNDIASLPQVWLPGGFGFQTFGMKDIVEILGNVKLRVHEIEKTPISIIDKKAILLYPNKIDVPILINPASAPIKPGTDGEIKIYADWYHPIYPILEKFGLEPSLAHADAPTTKIIFPAFISMIPRKNARHLIKKIALNASANKSFGILTFIAQSFLLPSQQLQSPKIFLIDELRGTNDLFVQLKGQFLETLFAKINATFANRPAMKKILQLLASSSLPIAQLPQETQASLAELKNQLQKLYQEILISSLINHIPASDQISLNSVIIRQDKILFSLEFAMVGSNTAWKLEMKPNKDFRWDFKPIPLPAHNQQYKRLKSGKQPGK